MKKISIWILLIALAMTGIEAHAEKFKRPDSYNYQRGLEAFQYENYEEAFEYLSRELKDNPKNGYAHTLISAIYYSNDDYGKALTEADAGLKYLPKKDAEYQSMAFIAKAGVLLVLEDTTQALSTYSTGIKNYPDQKILYEKRAQLYYELSQYEQSDADYRKLIEMEPGETLGYMGLGRNANARKQWEEAIKQFDYVTKLAPEYSSAYSFRAETYTGMEKWDEATDDLIKALEIDWDDYALSQTVSLKEPAFSLMMAKLKVQSAKSPQEASWPYIMGLAYQTNNKYEKAIEHFTKCNELDVSDEFYKRIAQCYYFIGNNAQALSNIDKALNMDSTDIEYLSIKSDILYEMGEFQQAINLLDKIIEYEPDLAEGYFLRGRIKRILDDYDGALEDMNMAIVLNPKLSYFYNARGYYYMKQGKMDLAEADFRKVIELETKPEDYSSIPYAYLGLGQYDKAIETNDSIIARNTTDNGGYYNAACLYARMNQPEKALEYLRKSLELGFRHFGHMNHDMDLESIRDLEGFQALIREFKMIGDGEIRTTDEIGNEAAPGERQTTEVPFTKEDGVCKVKCHINGLPLHFIFDTGASDVTLSMVEATFMVKNGYITDKDIVGSQRYMDANGNVSVGTVINLKEVDFGGFTLNNVKATVVLNQKAPLLLGQSVLGRLGKIEIDNSRQVLKITHQQ